jgi:hypothetical protein
LRSGSRSRRRARQLDLRAIAQPVSTLGDDDFAGLESRAYRNPFAIDHSQSHWTHAHGAIRIDDVDERGCDPVGRASTHG